MEDPHRRFAPCEAEHTERRSCLDVPCGSLAEARAVAGETERSKDDRPCGDNQVPQ